MRLAASARRRPSLFGWFGAPAATWAFEARKRDMSSLLSVRVCLAAESEGLGMVLVCGGLLASFVLLVLFAAVPGSWVMWISVAVCAVLLALGYLLLETIRLEGRTARFDANRGGASSEPCDRVAGPSDSLIGLALALPPAFDALVRDAVKATKGVWTVGGLRNEWLRREAFLRALGCLAFDEAAVVGALADASDPVQAAIDAALAAVRNGWTAPASAKDSAPSAAPSESVRPGR